MKAIIITHKGFEDISINEVKELTGADAKKRESVAVFDYKDHLDLCILSYKSQSAIKTIHLLCEFEVGKELRDTMEAVKKALFDVDLSNWVNENTTFKVACKRTGEHSFNSQDISIETGNLIKEKINKDINFDTPDLIIYIYIVNNEGYLGIDFSGIDLSKREYRIFAHPAALKGTVAYCMLRFGDYKKTHSLLDPFTKSGIIPIEAALYSLKKPVNFYRKDAMIFKHLKPLENHDWDSFFSKIDDEENENQKVEINGLDASMPSITAAQKNSKLAGVNKSINFSRIEVEWLDTKFSEKEIDRLVTNPPEASKRIDEKFIEKLYKELFYQAEYIMSDKGKIALLARNTDLLKKCAEPHKFTHAEERNVQLGKEEFKAIIFVKDK